MVRGNSLVAELANFAATVPTLQFSCVNPGGGGHA